jgi:hypothetical protein
VRTCSCGKALEPGTVYYLVERATGPSWAKWRGQQGITWTNDVHQADAYCELQVADHMARTARHQGTEAFASEHIDVA